MNSFDENSGISAEKLEQGLQRDLSEQNWPKAVQDLRRLVRQYELTSPSEYVGASWELSRLLAHLGYYSEAELHLKNVFDAISDPQQRLSLEQELAALHWEQGKYALAVESLQRAEDDVPTGEPFLLATIQLSLAKVWTVLGRFEEAHRKLEEAKNTFGSEVAADFRAYFELLEARLEYYRGRHSLALRLYEDAGKGFEASGDWGGKIEVLLGISAPLLEHQMIAESQKVLGLLSQWQDLASYPALHHAFKLRRLVLGAYTGNWEASDMEILSDEDLSLGRREDWLQFWFHLALSAKKLRKLDLFQNFIQKAKDIVEEISHSIPDEYRQAFEGRADVARILRLSGIPSQGSAQVQAQSFEDSLGSADAATLAPPRR